MRQPDPAFRTLLIVWTSLLMSHVVLLVVLKVLDLPVTKVEPTILVVLGVSALGSAVASRLVPTIVFRGAVQKLALPLTQVPDPEAPPGLNRTISFPKDALDALRRITPAYFTRIIIGCALAESVSLQGFVLRQIGAAWEVVLPFFGVGIALALLHIPSEQKLVQSIEKDLGIRLRV